MQKASKRKSDMSSVTSSFRAVANFRKCNSNLVSVTSERCDETDDLDDRPSSSTESLPLPHEPDAIYLCSKRYCETAALRFFLFRRFRCEFASDFLRLCNGGENCMTQANLTPLASSCSGERFSPFSRAFFLCGLYALMRLHLHVWPVFSEKASCAAFALRCSEVSTS